MQLTSEIETLLQEGTVIPAHPLALDSRRRLDEARQRRLTRYYLASGAGGIAVGVHTTQFAIRRPGINLLEPVLRLAAEEVKAAAPERTVIKVAGICGPTEQALGEARLAAGYGYDLGLVSLGGLQDYTDEQLIRHVAAVTDILPVFAFYLQPAVGGRPLSYAFWKKLAELPGVCAVKMAPFNRYQTLDVVRAVCYSSQRDRIALYTGNDDNIVADLLTPYRFRINGTAVEKRCSGGLLGHWSVWTHTVVKLFDRIKTCVRNRYTDMEELLKLGTAVTDMNAALFDPVHAFRGSIAGIHEVLRRQGLLEGIWCLDDEETLSPGQLQEIDRITADYPELTDDDFVKDFLLKNPV
ncbi:dihydrodipicolinate synthase family protein [Compostibacter hankyongensis]|uniref:Dihydrodipicolinate synthase family protein n=1 Tax=Compostibacter hankyongensis TaxID=1007089 RepID=A0ABP8G9N5_9BACT